MQTNSDGQKVIHLKSTPNLRTGKPGYPPGSRWKLHEADVVYLDGRKVKDKNGSLAAGSR